MMEPRVVWEFPSPPIGDPDFRDDIIVKLLVERPHSCVMVRPTTAADAKTWSILHQCICNIEEVVFFYTIGAEHFKNAF